MAAVLGSVSLVIVLFWKYVDTSVIHVYIVEWKPKRKRVVIARVVAVRLSKILPDVFLLSVFALLFFQDRRWFFQRVRRK